MRPPKSLPSLPFRSILVRPLLDEATSFTHLFAQQILDWCEQAGIPILDLSDDDAVRAKVEAAIRAELPPVFIFYDHGSEDALIGDDQKAVIDLNNYTLLDGCGIYTLACLSAKELGRKCYELGDTEFLGYAEIVSFTTDSLDDFQASFNCFFYYRYIEGLGAKAALDKAKATFDNLAEKLLDEGKTLAAALMSGNGDSLVCYNGEEPGPEEPEGCLVRLFKLPLLVLREIGRRLYYGAAY